MNPTTTTLGPSRAGVLEFLRSAGEPTTVATVAEAVRLHHNTTRFHLEGLTEAGLATRQIERSHRPGRPKALYQAVAGRDQNHFRQLATAMVRHFAAQLPDREEQARAAGEAWGTELRQDAERSRPDQQPLARLTEAMDRFGYRPQLQEGSEPALVLRPCPFLALAGAQPDVVCQLHLGLARGLLGPDQPWRASSIEPWATPERCLLHLARVNEASGEPATDATRAASVTPGRPGG